MDRDAETQPNTWLTKYITSIQAPSKIILTYLFKSEKRILINPPPPPQQTTFPRASTNSSLLSSSGWSTST